MYLIVVAFLIFIVHVNKIKTVTTIYRYMLLFNHNISMYQSIKILTYQNINISTFVKHGTTIGSSQSEFFIIKLYL